MDIESGTNFAATARQNPRPTVRFRPVKSLMFTIYE
jgi:hypothetical protein